VLPPRWTGCCGVGSLSLRGPDTTSAAPASRSSYAFTADIYSHIGPAQQREAADRLDQALRW
jgi:hypothetical protein